MARKPVTKAPARKADRRAGKTSRAPPKALKPSGATIDVLNVNTPGRTYRRNAEKYAKAREAYLAFMPAKAPGLTQAEMFEGMRKALPEFGSTSGWWMK